jgi:hypothetical protein
MQTPQSSPHLCCSGHRQFPVRSHCPTSFSLSRSVNVSQILPLRRRLLDSPESCVGLHLRESIWFADDQFARLRERLFPPTPFSMNARVPRTFLPGRLPVSARPFPGRKSFRVPSVHHLRSRAHRRRQLHEQLELPPSSTSGPSRPVGTFDRAVESNCFVFLKGASL